VLACKQIGVGVGSRLLEPADREQQTHNHMYSVVRNGQVAQRAGQPEFMPHILALRVTRRAKPVRVRIAPSAASRGLCATGTAPPPLFKPIVDAQGHGHSCLPVTDYTGPANGAMTFDTLTIPVNAIGNPAQVIRDFYDYTLYNHSTFGHLNADGLSFVDRQYPSPP